MAPFLAPTWYVESDAPEVIAFADEVLADVDDGASEVDRACKLFYAVRDRIRYSAYGIGMAPEDFRATAVLESGFGWCVTKSCLLAAVCRAAGIPCSLGYADVRNHLATEKLLATMGTDVFFYHGYNELYLEGKWVKATVAFNRSLCEKAGLHPLDFDGRNDSIYHPFALDGRRHMEYLHEYGVYADVPYDDIIAKFAKEYRSEGMFESNNQRSGGSTGGKGSPAELARADFENEVEAETAEKLRNAQTEGEADS